MFYVSIPGQADIFLGEWDTVAKAAKSALHLSASTGETVRIDHERVGCVAMANAQTMTSAEVVLAVAEELARCLER